MSERTPERTRARILSTALELFSTRGYADTSIRLIGKELGMTSATLYYHFKSKDDILESLCQPLLEDLRQLMDEARREQPTPQRALGALLDLALEHRVLVGAFFDDPSFYGHPTVGPKVVEARDLLADLLAGPEPTVRQLVRAHQAVAACKSVMHLPPDLPRDQVRREALAGACALLGLPEPD